MEKPSQSSRTGRFDQALARLNASLRRLAASVVDVQAVVVDDGPDLDLASTKELAVERRMTAEGFRQAMRAAGIRPLYTTGAGYFIWDRAAVREFYRRRDEERTREAEKRRLVQEAEAEAAWKAKAQQTVRDWERALDFPTNWIACLVRLGVLKPVAQDQNGLPVFAHTWSEMNSLRARRNDLIGAVLKRAADEEKEKKQRRLESDQAAERADRDRRERIDKEQARHARIREASQIK